MKPIVAEKIVTTKVKVLDLPYKDSTSDFASVHVERHKRFGQTRPDAVKVYFHNPVLSYDVKAGETMPMCWLTSTGLREVAALFNDLANALDAEAKTPAA